MFDTFDLPIITRDWVRDKGLGLKKLRNTKHRAVNTVYFKSCDISAGFLRLKDIKLKTQRKCHGQNAENPAEMSRLSLKTHFNYTLA